MPTDPNDIAGCDDPPLEAQAGHDFCPGASCGECDDEGSPLEVIARASDLEEGARFVAMRDELVLAEPVSVRVTVDEESIEGAFLTYGEEASMCIYGDGDHCIRRGVFETIVTGEGGRLLAVDERGEWLVGENGPVVRLQGYEASEPYHGISTRLHTVASSFDGKSAWAAGEGGVFLALGEAGPRICKAPSFDIVAATKRRLLSATEIRGEVEGMYACAPPPPPPEDIRKPPFPPPSPTGWPTPPIFPADR